MFKTISITMNTRVELEVPKTCNFVKRVGGKPISIADIDEETLKAIGKTWTENLIENAKMKRGKNDT